MTNDILWGTSQLIGIALPALLLFTRWGAALCHAIGRRVGGNRFLTLALFAAVYLGLYFGVEAPIALLRGMSVVQLAVQTVVEIIVAALVLSIPYTLMRYRLWWLWSALALVPIAFGVLVALPVFVDPLTAHYEPLSDKALGAEIKALAARCGVLDIPVFIGGDDDTVAGLGPTKRIFLESNITKTETHDQIMFTVGHELKHYVMGDSWKAFAIVVAVLLVGFWLVDRVGNWAIARAQFGFTTLSDPASLPLVIMIFSAFWLLVLPLFNLEARHIEFEGDRFGLELTHQNKAASELFAKWISEGEPGGTTLFFRIFRQTHPTLNERIAFANRYHPWATGEALGYGDTCNRSGRLTLPAE